MNMKASVSNKDQPFEFDPNILDLYDSSTYNLKLFTLTESDHINRMEYDSTKHITIVQNGVTDGLVIEDLQIETVPGFTARTRSGTSTTLNFTIKQALGADFLDYLAKKAGSKLYTVLPYFIEIKFFGNTVDGSLDGEDLRGQSWLFPIKITSCSISVDAGGSTYNILSAIQNDLAFYNNYGDIDKIIKISDSTLGGYFGQLEGIMNDRQKEKAVSGVRLADKYQFILDDALINEKIIPANFDANASNQSGYNINEVGETTVTISNGTGILEAIESVMSNCPYFQKEAKAGDGADGKPESDPTGKIPKIFRVHTDVRINAMDESRQDFSRTFIYYIKVYDIPTVLLDVPKEGDGDAILKYIMEYRRMRKHYNYIYTGKNDQVLNFNIEFKMAWYVNVPQQGGLNTDNTSTPAMAAALPATDAKAKRVAEEKLVNQTNPMAATNVTKQDAGGYNNQEPTVSAVLPVSKVETTVPSTIGTESAAGDGRNHLTAIFDQITGGDMLAADIEIKGDPFWLEPGPVTYATKNGANKSFKEIIDTDTKTSVHTKNGEVFLLFTSQTPTINNLLEEQKFTNNTILNGIYKVVTISSVFNEGKFTQKLHGVRVPHIDYNSSPELKEIVARTPNV